MRGVSLVLDFLKATSSLLFRILCERICEQRKKKKRKMNEHTHTQKKDNITKRTHLFFHNTTFPLHILPIPLNTSINIPIIGIKVVPEEIFFFFFFVRTNRKKKRREEGEREKEKEKKRKGKGKGRKSSKNIFFFYLASKLSHLIIDKKREIFLCSFAAWVSS